MRNGMVIEGKRFEVLIHMMHMHVSARLHESYGLHHSLLRQYCTLGGRLCVQTILYKRMHPLLAASSRCIKAIDITVRGRTSSKTLMAPTDAPMSEACAPKHLAGLVSTHG